MRKIPNSDEAGFPTWKTLLLIIIGLIGLASASAVFLYEGLGSVGLEMLTIITSIVLTSSLVMLYFMQSKISRQQLELMKRKSRSDPSIKPPMIAEDDKFIIPLKNLGEGSVSSLYLNTEIRADTDMVLEPRSYQLRVQGDDRANLEPLSDRYEFQGKVGARTQVEEDKTSMSSDGYLVYFIRKMLKNVRSRSL